MQGKWILLWCLISLFISMVYTFSFLFLFTMISFIRQTFLSKNDHFIFLQCYTTPLTLSPAWYGFTPLVFLVLFFFFWIFLIKKKTCSFPRIRGFSCSVTLSDNSHSFSLLSPMIPFTIFYISCMSETIWWLSFSNWLTSLRIIPSSSIHIEANGEPTSFLTFCSRKGCCLCPLSSSSSKPPEE